VLAHAHCRIINAVSLACLADLHAQQDAGVAAAHQIDQHYGRIERAQGERGRVGNAVARETQKQRLRFSVQRAEHRGGGQSDVHGGSGDESYVGFVLASNSRRTVPGCFPRQRSSRQRPAR
jgi:hypothetical protein